MKDTLPEASLHLDLATGRCVVTEDDANESFMDFHDDANEARVNMKQLEEPIYQNRDGEKYSNSNLKQLYRQ
jgi:hypothetical protein